MKVDLLRAIYLFKEMTDAELSIIAKAGSEKNFISGQELFFSGQKAEAMYVVMSGMIRIFKSTDNADEIALSTIAAGEHFGEMGFLTRDPRTATAQIIETSDVFEINYENLESALKSEIIISEKFYRALARFLAQRLKSTTQELLSAKEK